VSSTFTVILPHKRNPGNDAALTICMDMLKANTVSDNFEILISCVRDGLLFPTIDRLFRQAETEYLVFWNSDMFPAPNWDILMLEQAAHDVIVNPVLVEPGAIGLYAENLLMDFGRRPDTFRRDEFEEWSQSENASVPDGEGFFAPYMIARQRYLDLGGFDLTGDLTGFVGRDMDLYAAHKANGGRVVRVGAYVYHLQRYSELTEQQKENRQ